MLLRILKSLPKRQISSDRTDRLLCQLACFAGAVGVLMCMGRAVQRFASTPFEIFAVVLMVALLALSLVILGIIIAPTCQETPKSRESETTALSARQP